MRKLLLRIILNYVVFIVLRYANIFMGFGFGFGTASNYQKWYVTWIHLPALVIQITTIYLVARKWKEGYHATVVALFLISMFLISHFLLGNMILLPK